jgi:hypothetical protein
LKLEDVFLFFVPGFDRLSLVVALKPGGRLSGGRIRSDVDQGAPADLFPGVEAFQLHVQGSKEIGDLRCIFIAHGSSPWKIAISILDAQDYSVGNVRFIAFASSFACFTKPTLI